MSQMISTGRVQTWNYRYIEGKRKTPVTDGIKDADELNLDHEIGRFGAEPE